MLVGLRNEIGLTTLVPESHLTHTSGFKIDPLIEGPLDAWAEQQGLELHRRVFGVQAPARPVLPGILGGWDDTSLLRVIDAARSADLEVWGHAGLWCYGGEIFPDLAAHSIFGSPLPPETRPWGAMFCPSKTELNRWIVASFSDAAARYDLDGWFVDHARYTSPGDGLSLLACGCQDCGEAASEMGFDFDRCRDSMKRLKSDLAAMTPDQLATTCALAPTPATACLDPYPGVVEWFQFRARLLADRFADIANAVRAASRRPVEFGSDVFPPSVAVFGGHAYELWTTTATYLTGGFTPGISWASVAGVTARGVAPWLQAWVRGLDTRLAERVVGQVLGLTSDDVSAERDGPTIDALVRELKAIAGAAPDVPTYVPIPAGLDPDGLRRVCCEIVAAHLDGAMMVGLDAFTAEQRAIVGAQLAAPLRA